MSRANDRVQAAPEITVQQRCPCESGKTYADCCQPYLAQGVQPVTAEALMRSRYSAYVLADSAYVLRTWHPSSRPAQLNGNDADATHWLGLKIIRRQQGGSTDTVGLVEFVARYKINGRAYRLHETSEFVREGGQWFYVRAL